MDSKKKILVTGGAGFIGSHLCKRLVAMGQPVVCIDNLNTYYNPLRKIENIRPLVGNSKPVDLDYFISVIEGLLGKKAKIQRRPPLPGDVPITYADVGKAWKLFGYQPKVGIEQGMEHFARWYFDHVVSPLH